MDAQFCHPLAFPDVLFRRLQHRFPEFLWDRLKQFLFHTHQGGKGLDRVNPRPALKDRIANPAPHAHGSIPFWRERAASCVDSDKTGGVPIAAGRK